LANGQKQEFKDILEKMKAVNWKFESAETVEI
jgi:hypothetical protein